MTRVTAVIYVDRPGEDDIDVELTGSLSRRVRGSYYSPPEGGEVELLSASRDDLTDEELERAQVALEESEPDFDDEDPPSRRAPCDY